MNAVRSCRIYPYVPDKSEQGHERIADPRFMAPPATPGGLVAQELLSSGLI